ncbi:hypothetical protein C8Q74DRAFT_1216798 [Fomes fomentarius]|nr:hypothetical protein C8Q74DRAFT_1216798 [Fomes fomentarius]
MVWKLYTTSRLAVGSDRLDSGAGMASRKQGAAGRAHPTHGGSGRAMVEWLKMVPAAQQPIRQASHRPHIPVWLKCEVSSRRAYPTHGHDGGVALLPDRGVARAQAVGGRMRGQVAVAVGEVSVDAATEWVASDGVMGGCFEGYDEARVCVNVGREQPVGVIPDSGSAWSVWRLTLPGHFSAALRLLVTLAPPGQFGAALVTLALPGPLSAI